MPHSGMRLNELQMAVTHSEMSLQDTLDQKKRKALDNWWGVGFFHFIYFPFIHLEVQPKDVEIVKKC